jgi:glycerol-3-phosphate dehydrogenase
MYSVILFSFQLCDYVIRKSGQEQKMKNIIDIFIIGGGINGVAIAADAAGRGLSVALAEKNDLGGGTSSASSKLIHGGLRYLETYEFNLVRKALLEREVLLFRAPHLVSPLEFILPHEKHLRPAWMIRVGLFLYDHLARRKHLKGSKTVNLHDDRFENKLVAELTKGFSYFDCFTDDSRLVIANALSAKDNGANILTHTEFLSAVRENNYWKITLKNTSTHEIFFCYAKALINVAGPWIKDVHAKIQNTQLRFDIELDKGSHIVVPKIYDGDYAYILQNKDQRIVFAIPYQKHFTLIGTTDVEYTGKLNDIHISSEEENYLCQLINQYFKKSIQPSDIVWSYAGVRCLQKDEEDNPADITRDYKFLTEEKDQSLLMTVIGGKLTTHRTLGEEAVNRLKEFFPAMKPAWTRFSPLPGGDMSDFHKFSAEFSQQFPFLPKSLRERYTKNYGTRAHLLMHNKKSIADLGIDFGQELFQNEVEYLLQEEWAKTAEDILWRRTKLGLFMSDQEKNKLKDWLT